MTSPKWKKFEKVVYEIQKTLAQDADVKLDDSLYGHDSKQNRQIDISIKRSIGQYKLLIIIDCKDYDKPLDVKDIGEFATVLRDVKANKGAMISSQGFTKAALELAKTYGIDTLRLIDTKNVDWKVYASIPVVLERTYLKNFKFIFFNFDTLPASIKSCDIKTLKVFDKNNNPLGNLGDLIAMYWNNENKDLTLGERQILLNQGAFLEIENKKISLKIAAVICVERKFYAGNLQVDLQGFKNEQTGGVITKEFTTSFINPGTIEAEVESGNSKDWRVIDDPEKLTTKPLFMLSYTDCLPITTESLP